MKRRTELAARPGPPFSAAGGTWPGLGARSHAPWWAAGGTWAGWGATGRSARDPGFGRCGHVGSTISSRLRVPLFESLRGYQRSWAPLDIAAGLTLVAVAVPEQMATAKLANMPAQAGLYAFICGSLAIAVLGAHKNMSVGSDSTIAPVFAAGVAGVAAVGTGEYSSLVVLVALITGVLVVLVGLLRAGWIADFLPVPVIFGVLAGIGIEIVVRQLPSVLGLQSGGTTTIGRVRVLIDRLGHVNGWAVALAAGVLIVVVAAERIDHRIPGALIGVVASTAIVAGAGLRSHGVQVVGTIHAGLPNFGFPSAHWDVAGKLAATILTVGFLCVAQTAATARSGDTASETSSQLNRDLLAVGAGSVLASFSGTFAVNASPPRTAVVQSAGGRSQVTSLIAAGATVVVLSAAGLLKDLPLATLGAILIFVAFRLFRVKELGRVAAFDRIEFAVAVITVLLVALVGIEQGVAAAVALSLAQRTRIAARPRGVVLGREPGTDHWIPTDIGRPTEQVPGLLVYMPYAALWYGNATYVAERLQKTIDAASPPVKALILDADGMSDVDYTAARRVDQLARELKAKGIAVGVARTSHLVHHDLKHSGLLAELGSDHAYATVQDAVAALSPDSGSGS